MAVNIALIIVILLIAISLLLLFYFVGRNWFKKNPATNTNIKTERGLIYFDCKHGLCIIDEIDENIKSGYYDLKLRNLDGTPLPNYKIQRTVIDIVNPGRENELWRDLSAVGKNKKLADALSRETESRLYHEQQHVMLKANMKEEVDKRVEQVLKTIPQYKPDAYKK